MGVNSLPKTLTGERRGCDLNPGPSAPKSSTLTTRLPSHPELKYMTIIIIIIIIIVILYTTLHPFNGLFSWITWVSRYQKDKTSLDLNDKR